MARDGLHHQTGPNSDLAKMGGRCIFIKHFRNIETPKNMATGDIETHSDSDRPLQLWGIGFPALVSPILPSKRLVALVLAQWERAAFVFIFRPITLHSPVGNKWEMARAPP
jgi:hypothetical protein